MITFDDKELKQLERDLKLMAERAFPFATKATLNRAAFETQKLSRTRLSQDFTLRNQFTKGSVRVDQARGLSIPRQAAYVGSIAGYLETQEFGGVEKGGGKNKPIPTSYSAGQGDNARPRTRLPRKPNKLASIQLKRRAAGSKGRRQRNLIAVKEAAGSGNKFVYLDLGRRRGIFRVLGSKKRPRIKMLWDLSRRSVRIAPSPWLSPSTDRAAIQLPDFYKEALSYQLKRNKILGYR